MLYYSGKGEYKMKRTYKKLICVILSAVLLLSALPLTVHAAATTYSVSTPEQLRAAVNAINSAGAGEYTISLATDIYSEICGIDIGSIEDDKTDTVVTIIGNGHYLSCPTGQNVQAWNGAKVILGDGETELTLVGGVTNDNPGVVYVIGQDSVCIMNDKVTIKDNQTSNYFGGGVSVWAGSFIMNGGTIENCSVKGGSICYGGGVGVINGGSFTMNGGTIKDCYVENEVENENGYQYPYTAGGGVFVCRSDFTMNNGLIENCWADSSISAGGGIAVINSDISVSEHNRNLGYIDSGFSMNGGEIKDCSAFTGGALVFGLGSVKISALCTKIGGTAYPGSAQAGLYLNGGKMNGNGSGYGGAIFINTIRETIPVNIKNMELKSNEASYGGGISVLSFWVEPKIENCTINDNIAYLYGGGIYVKDAAGTYLKDTTITGNTIDIAGGNNPVNRGAGVYYYQNAKVYLSGSNTIQNNTTFTGEINNLNVYSLTYPVYVNGDLTGSQIGLSDPTLWGDGKADSDPEAVSTEYLTNGYKENNPEAHPSEFFTSDHETWIVDRSTKTTTTVDDPSSNKYREYKVKRYPVLPSTNPYAGHLNQYVITETQNPDLKSVSSWDMNQIISEMTYRFNNSNYTNTRNINSNGNVYIQYAPVDSNSPLASVTLQKSSYDSFLKIIYAAKQPRGGSVEYRATISDQNNYANAGELVLKINSNGDTNLSKYTFSEEYTEETVKYVNLNPPNPTTVLYEYDENGDVAAKLEVVSYETKSTQIIVETGTDAEVRLVRKTTVDYHINNQTIADAKYQGEDIFTSYVAESTGKDITIGDTINAFYTVPEVTPTVQNSCPYIFKGWYYDKANDNDTRPVNFGTDKYTAGRDIYAHWIEVKNVAKAGGDEYDLPEGETEYGGFDLTGVQVRNRIIDTNFDNELRPGGLRFMTSLSMDVVNQINAIKDDNIEYGYVAATRADWIDAHESHHDKLQYVSKTANGKDTTDSTKPGDYFGFATNVICTSNKTNTGGVVIEDHRNFKDYLLYTLVITYEDGKGLDKNVLARPYIRYTDANGLERVAYSEYRGRSNTLGGCYTSFNAVYPKP